MQPHGISSSIARKITESATLINVMAFLPPSTVYSSQSRNLRPAPQREGGRQAIAGSVSAWQTASTNRLIRKTRTWRTPMPRSQLDNPAAAPIPRAHASNYWCLHRHAQTFNASTTRSSKTQSIASALAANAGSAFTSPRRQRCRQPNLAASPSDAFSGDPHSTGAAE
jgi:hypothetical protein